MEDEQFSVTKNHRVMTKKRLSDERVRIDRTETAESVSQIANMDQYDYINLLAESRIVDIAWVY